MMTEPPPPIGTIFCHYKGGRYRLVARGLNVTVPMSKGEWMWVYSPLDQPTVYYVRTEEDWQAPVQWPDGKTRSRFVREDLLAEHFKTYAEKELVPHGFQVVERGGENFIVVEKDGQKTRLGCSCPAPGQRPTALGCPLHHPFTAPGCSWPIQRLLHPGLPELYPTSHPNYRGDM